MAARERVDDRTPTGDVETGILRSARRYQTVAWALLTRRLIADIGLPLLLLLHLPAFFVRP